MSDVSIDFPEKDVRDLFKAIDAGVKYMGMHTNHALNSAARFVLRSVGASTRTAPKERKVQHAAFAALPPNMRGRNLKAFGVTGWFGKPRTFQTKIVFSRDEATAKRRHGRIGRRGLAKAAWKSGAREARVFGGGHTLSAGAGDVMRLANKMSSGSRVQSQGWLTYTITNAVPYIEKAMRGGGKRAIDTAMARASRSMMKSIETQLVKKMGLGALSR